MRFGLAEPASLYVHVPFCERKCFYCAFNSSNGVRQEEVRRYLDAIDVELELKARKTRLPLRTVFFGGGTPTAVDAASLDRLLGAVRARFRLEANFEWTVEANPATLTSEKLDVLRAHGVNRVSIGAQTFDADGLKRLGRIHEADAISQTIENVRAAGFGRFSLDLIFGRPDQTLDSWESDLLRLAALRPPHASLYGLQYESGTPYARGRDRGLFHDAADDVYARMYVRAREVLHGIGLTRYEISNYAAPGDECRHNLAYWRNASTLGVGPGAYEFVEGRRRRNFEDLDAWATAVLDDSDGAEESDDIDAFALFQETLVAGLRTVEGVDLDALGEATGVPWRRRSETVVRRWATEGLADLSDGVLRLTEAGFLVSDAILAELIRPEPASA